MDNKNTKIDKILNIVCFALLAVEAIAAVCFIIMLFRLNMLPAFYMAAIILILIGIPIGLFFLRKNRVNSNSKKNRIRKNISSLIALILSVILFVGSYLVYMADHVLSSVTNEGIITKTYRVVVMVDDPAQSIEDTADYNYGTVKASNHVNIDKALQYIEENDGLALNVIEKDSIKKTLDAFYDGVVDGLIYDTSISTMFKEFKETYESDIRVIKEFKISVNQDELESFVIETSEEEEETTAYSSNIKPFVVLLSGSDEYDELSVNGRSDVDMLAVVNFSTRQVLLVSIPRDYYVEFPGISDGERDKLTHSGIYGIDTLCNSISNVFHVNIDYYCRVNFTSVVDIIDAIGGVMIDNPYEFTGYDNGMVFQKGLAWYNGYWALQYMRERKSLEGGDLARGQHQQIVLEAMINKLTSFSSIANFNALIAAIEKGAIMNVPEEFIKELIRTQLAEGGSWKILKTQALGDEVYQPSFAMDGMVVSVVMPYKESVDFVSDQIKKVYNGVIINDINEGAPTELTYITDLIDCE